MERRLNRRQFLGGAATGVGLAALPASYGADAPIPTRTLGRIGFKNSILGLGMAPIGMMGSSRAEAERLVDEALDLGVNYVDVAPNYSDAEAKLAPMLKRRRDGIFLVTKVEAQRKDGILGQIRNSLKLMGVDHLDAVHLHNLGDFDLKAVFEDENGGMAGLREAKRLGYVRYFGISGHLKPWKFTEAIKTGEVDLVMSAMNFVDRHTYNFEEKVLPEARKHGTAVVAMKVLGGAVRMDYGHPNPAMLADYYESAVRYALGLDGISAVVLGLKNSDEIRKAAATARAYKPLSAAELETLTARGKELAQQWGPHFGPVV